MRPRILGNGGKGGKFDKKTFAGGDGRIYIKKLTKKRTAFLENICIKLSMKFEIILRRKYVIFQCKRCCGQSEMETVVLL